VRIGTLDPLKRAIINDGGYLFMNVSEVDIMNITFSNRVSKECVLILDAVANAQISQCGFMNNTNNLE
jgi:hypothetical protein